MTKAVIIETDTPTPDNIKNKASANHISVIHLASLDEYNGSHDYVLEYSEEITDEELEHFFCRAKEQPIIIAQTERLLIRELCPDDAESLLKLFADFPDAFSKSCGLIYQSDNYSASDNIEIEKNLIKQYVKYQYNFYDYGLWLLTLKDTPDEVVGLAGFYDSDPVMISYGILSKYRKHGYCTEALQAVLTFAKNKLKISDISAEISSCNNVSIDIAHKFGINIIMIQGSKG